MERKQHCLRQDFKCTKCAAFYHHANFEISAFLFFFFFEVEIYAGTLNRVN